MTGIVQTLTALVEAEQHARQPELFGGHAHG
jgi:hypothetical protein